MGTLVAALAVAGTALTSDRANPRQFLITVQVLDATAPDSADVAVPEVLAEPSIMTTEGRAFEFQVGERIQVPGSEETAEVGTVVQGQLASRDNGRVRADLHVAISELVERSDNDLQIDSHACRFVKTLPLGKPVRLAWGPSQNCWLQLTVTDPED